MDGGLGRLELRPQGCLGGLAQGGRALRLDVLLVQALDVVGLSQRLGAQGPQGGRERLAVLGIALRWSAIHDDGPSETIESG